MNDNIISMLWTKIKIGVKSIGKGIIFLLKGLFTFLDSIKMVFIIPLLSLVATVFSLVVIVIIQPLINQLPGFLSEGFVHALIAAIIYIILSQMVFIDRVNKNLSFKVKDYLISFIGASIFFILPTILLKRQGAFLGDFYAEEFVDYLSAFDSVSTLIYLVFFTPHFWLATITKEYIISVSIALLINGIIFVVVAITSVNYLGAEPKQISHNKDDY